MSGGRDALTTRTLLLVDDSATDARLVRAALATLRDPGCHVLHVDDLAAARDLLSREPVDLALLDLHLPTSQGLATLHEFRNAHPRLPVIVVTGTEEPGLADAVLALGAEDAVAKGGHGFILGLRLAVRMALERIQVLDAMRQASAEAESARDAAAHLRNARLHPGPVTGPSAH